ncbi:MAG: phage tail sheath subtilisin-like domain-containing protein [Nannocystaceae bacterium]
MVSVGPFGEPPLAAHFEAGLALIAKEDEPTLLILGDAVNLDAVGYYAIAQQALALCARLGDRFAILDVPGGDVDAFRGPAGVGAADLKYGAAYHPYLETSLSAHYDEAEVQVIAVGADATSSLTFGAQGVEVTHLGPPGVSAEARFVAGDGALSVEFVVDGAARKLTVTNVDGRSGADVVAAWATWRASNDPHGFDLRAAGAGDGAIDLLGSTYNELASAPPLTLDALKSGPRPETGLYNAIRAALAAERLVLPPSAAIAGIYCQTDASRGVWKAPANVGVAAVIGPVAKISSEEQERLNVDPTGGKSINALRAFAGRGTLVWGARTLAGNDNEWRYVPVRRLFITVEESCRKATAFAVFEPNDGTTWLKVKGMIESYLYGLWERGALAGSKPDAAYFVHVGLGKTMTAQDVLEGRMIVEVGLAAVRPAEFIVLRFSHRLQEA